MSPLSSIITPQTTTSSADFFPPVQSGIEISDGSDNDSDSDSTNGRMTTGGRFDDDDDDDYKDVSITDVSQITPTEGAAGLDDDFEDKAVQCFRLFVLFVLVAAMAAAGACTYTFIMRDQQEHFQLEVRRLMDSTCTNIHIWR